MALQTSFFKKNFDLSLFKGNSSELYNIGYSLGYKDFEKTAFRCREMFEEAGLSEVECIPIPADGTSAAMDFVMPMAWEVEDASLDIVGPEPLEEHITDLNIDRFCVANRCPPTPSEGITAEVVLWEDVMAGADASGKIVLCLKENPIGTHHQIIKKGAAAIVSGYSEAGKELGDATFWINGSGFPYWYHTKDDKVIPCFSIPLRKAARIAELLKKNGTLVMKAVVKSRLYSGQLYTVTGIIPGIEPDEITLISHIYEPFLNDNYTGAAAHAEIARMIRKGIQSGKLPPLKKTVRFVVSMEQYGTAHYFEKHVKEKRTLLAINVDGISYDTKKTGRPVYVYTSPYFLPSCTDLILGMYARQELSEYPLKVLPGDLGDDSFVSDRTIGIPTHYFICHPGKYHHNSLDRFDDITDWKTAADLTCFIAAFVSTIASADKEELTKMLSDSVKLAGEEISQKAEKIADAVQKGKLPSGEATERLSEFGRWMKGVLEAFKRFDPTVDIKEAVEKLDGVILNETSRLSEEYPPVKRPLTRAERYAANMLIRRTAMGIPASLARVPAHERFEHAPGREFILNWLDENTNLLAAMRKTSMVFDSEYPKEKEIKRFVRYIRELEKYGYVSVRYLRTYTYEDIVNSLKSLGIKAGDKVIVHSSLSSMGHVEGGPETVCRALMDVITYDGLLMMPSFNMYRIFQENRSAYYDHVETPAGTGAITEYFRKIPGVLRSLDVSNAFAAWGKDAREFLKDHHRVPTMYYGSPLQKLEEADGKVILIDCPNSFTFAHVVELTNKVPCHSLRTEEYPAKLPDGRMVKLRTWSYRSAACPLFEAGSVPGKELPEFLELEPEKLYPPTVRIYGMLEKDGLLKYGYIGDAPAYSFKLKDWRRYHETMMRDGVPDLGISGCSVCPVRPRVNERTVETDWDDENMRLKPDTDAFTGDIM